MDNISFTNELKQMILSSDNSIHNIESYGMDFFELDKVWNGLTAGECLIAAHTYGALYYQITKNGAIVKTIQLMNTDKDFVNRYVKVRNTVNSILSQIDNRMTEIEKVLIVHDYIITNTKYQDISLIAHYAGGPLGLGVGVCEGYTDALRLLCKLLNINTSYIVSNTMNHQWAYLQLNGEWYHIDTTWDDTVSSVTGETSHTFFIRNDSEFLNTLSKKHYNWYNPINTLSKSTKYCNWFVHEVIGNMYYLDQYWYYIQYGSNSIVRSKIDGSAYQVLEDGRISGRKLKVIGIKNNQLVYFDGSNTQYINIGDIPTPFCEITNSSNGLLISTSIENIDLINFTMWRTGHYSLLNGKYVSYPSRICLIGYASCSINTDYKIACSDRTYHVLIREMTENLEFIKSNDLSDGSTFTTSPNTKYLGISIYNISNSALSFNAYMTLFASGFVVKISKQAQKSYATLESVNLCDFNQWRTGHYNLTTGIYEPYGSRICLKDYVSCNSNVKYMIIIPNDNFNVLVREMSINLLLIKSNDLKNGSSFTTTSNTKFLAISIYNNRGEQVSYRAYQDMFMSAFCIGFM